jgi:hypothetical protein
MAKESSKRAGSTDIPAPPDTDKPNLNTPPEKQEPLTPAPPVVLTDLTQAITQALNIPVDSVSPEFKKGQLPDEQVNKVIGTIASIRDMPIPLVIIGIILLFLKGAASGTPLSLSVEIGAFELSKRDLLNAYQAVTGNKFLRRMAEAMAITIGTFAEKNKLRGELAQKIETALKAETGERLTSKELAWCSSFNQHLENLPELGSPRLVKLLAADYNKRFVEKKNKKEKEKEKGDSTPKAKGEEKPRNSQKK